MVADHAVVVAKGLNKSFATTAEVVRAVRDVDLVVSESEFVCLHGASGSGKSTLLSLLAGLSVPDSGEVIVGGERISALDESGRASARLQRIGVIHQDDNLIEEFTAVENVSFPLELRGRSAAVGRAAALESLDRVGVVHLAERFPRELSGGQRQRVGVARALTGDRRILLADEPTGSLDSLASRELFELFKQMCSSGVAALVASHDPECREFASRTLEIVDGALV